MICLDFSLFEFFCLGSNNFLKFINIYLTKFGEIFLIISLSTFCIPVVFCFYSRTPDDPLLYHLILSHESPKFYSNFIVISLCYLHYVFSINLCSGSLTIPSVISIVWLILSSDFKISDIIIFSSRRSV